ncbi:MAG: hypothetical protein ACI306_05280 [Muribaculaceae bacterium]
MLLTIFLHPAMLFVLIVIPVYGLYRYIVLKEVQYKKLLVATALCGLMALSYSVMMYKNHGYFAYTKVSVFNDFNSLLKGNVVSINDIAAEDDEVSDYITSHDVSELDSLYNKFGGERIYKIMRDITCEHHVDLLMLAGSHFICTLKYDVCHNSISDVMSYFVPPLWLLYTILLIFAVWLFVARLNRNIFADSLLLIMMPLGLILVALYAAYAEYDRLIYPCSWALYLMGFILIDKFIYHYAKKG